MKKYGSGFLTMTEYIEREALIEHIKDLPTWWANGGGVYGGSMKYPDGMFDCEDVVGSIENAPAADVVPVRHGRWEWLGPNRLVTDCMCGTCSVCKVRSKYIVNTMLCTNCGAKMDGGGENG